ncbi:GNAT family N-acetyltransferase [Microbacterium halotolerans]|uniref:GNAT family N-acetyltransferase n=1 Tax=Microbacterium halotolerans TaxID=246613 RepID=UPI0019691BE9|nr:GNAT family N-acetyltransferase [Microbacterium halotolerans]
MESQVQVVRAFNRVVTERIGALADGYLARNRSLGLDRVVWEIGRTGIDVRELRSRLGLDSGYVSRQLRSLEEEGLVTVSPSPQDGRVRRAALTARGVDELALLDQLSDDMVGSILTPLSERQRHELAEAAATVQRLFTASAVLITPVDPGLPEARRAVDAYYQTLDSRFEGGFRPEQSLPAADDAFQPPHGLFLLATLKGRAVGCISITSVTESVAELRRLWVSPDVRGLGIGRRLLETAEEAGRSLGASLIRLETNKALTEAISLYRASGYREVAAFNKEPYAHHWFEKTLHGSGPEQGPIGFIGLGIMGLPMARRLARAGVPLAVWNRTPKNVVELIGGDAKPAESVGELFDECETIIVMLRNESAIDAVLRDHPEGLGALVAGRTIINMGTLSPEFSKGLSDEIEAAGGNYVEAPVSGSRRPAEDGKLVAMVAGQPDVVPQILPLLDPLCATTTVCGPVPSGITMKLAVNVFLIALVTGLAEAFHFAQAHGIDLQKLRSLLDAGQMSSPISRVKTERLTSEDFTAQAAISDVHMNAKLIVDAAATQGAHAPLSELCEAIYREAENRGDGALDMAGIIRTIADAEVIHTAPRPAVSSEEDSVSPR